MSRFMVGSFGENASKTSPLIYADARGSARKMWSAAALGWRLFAAV
jgi:hypothetical protein